jgi:hypothetical protein
VQKGGGSSTPIVLLFLSLVISCSHPIFLWKTPVSSVHLLSPGHKEQYQGPTFQGVPVLWLLWADFLQKKLCDLQITACDNSFKEHDPSKWLTSGFLSTLCPPLLLLYSFNVLLLCDFRKHSYDCCLKDISQFGVLPCGLNKGVCVCSECVSVWLWLYV